jgi:hypothetical protein
VRRLHNGKQAILMREHFVSRNRETLERRGRTCVTCALECKSDLSCDTFQEPSTRLRSGERSDFPQQPLDLQIVLSQGGALHASRKLRCTPGRQQFVEKLTAFEQHRRLVAQVFESTEFRASRLDCRRAAMMYYKSYPTARL